ncbi:GTPase [Thermopolyspora sp. NPDC052614]|uniref:GTPase n=1 Tax=Thermopolyspora sp. NPDC052614 TaxID=3155682 RepID=UPI0034483F9B
MTLGTTTASAQHGLGARLAALARIVELGPGRVDATLLRDAGQLLLRAGERLRLSADHTVVALAGGTGSGKSSLFNRVSGLELSPTGVRRPTTARTHACVWGLEGAAPLLDWLQIQWRHRFARASALDRGESRLHGLILLDLPDHDSIRALNDTEAERLIKLADLVVWVLDPQKYADASIHRRYLSELKGHEATTVFVLNQVDKLAPEELVECVGDLAELLKREGVEHPRLVSTSALTGRGLDGLKGVLAESVSQRRAAVQRLEADLDRLLEDFTKAMPMPEVTTVRPTVDPARQEALVDALCDAVGLTAVGEAVENVYAARSIEWVGWPYARWAAKLRPDPLSSLRVGDLREEIGELVGGSVTAQPAEVANAVQALTDGLTAGMPEAWSNGVRDAGRSASGRLPQTLSEQLSRIAPKLDQVPGWWWAAKIWQYALVVLFAAGFLWAGAILVYGVLGVGDAPGELLEDVAVLPWLGLMMASVLGLGALSSIASRNFVILGAGTERERLVREMRQRVAAIAAETVIAPVERELHRYNEFFAAMSVVRR